MWSLLSLLLALPLTTSIPLQPRQLSSCPNYMVIEAPGLGDPTGTWTSDTTEGILAGLSGGQRYLMKTPEPADDGPDTAYESILVNATLGSAEIVETVATNFATCPEIKFVIFGYSYGTIEVNLAMNNPALLRAPIAAVIMYGNCFWHPDQPGNQGTATSGTAVCLSELEDLPIGTPVTYQDVVADFCLVNDYLCTGAPYGSPLNSHWSYKDSQWQTDAIDFAIARLQSGNNFPALPAAS